MSTIYPKAMKIRWRWDGDTNEHITYFNPKSGTINILNPVAAYIFNVCNGNNTVEQIIDRVCEEYDAPNRDLVTKDVNEFLHFMEKNEIIKYTTN